MNARFKTFRVFMVIGWMCLLFGCELKEMTVVDQVEEFIEEVEVVKEDDEQPDVVKDNRLINDEVLNQLLTKYYIDEKVAVSSTAVREQVLTTFEASLGFKIIPKEFNGKIDEIVFGKERVKLYHYPYSPKELVYELQRGIKMKDLLMDSREILTYAMDSEDHLLFEFVTKTTGDEEEMVRISEIDKKTELILTDQLREHLRQSNLNILKTEVYGIGNNLVLFSDGINEYIYIIRELYTASGNLDDALIPVQSWLAPLEFANIIANYWGDDNSPVNYRGWDYEKLVSSDEDLIWQNNYDQSYGRYASDMKMYGIMLSDLMNYAQQTGDVLDSSPRILPSSNWFYTVVNRLLEDNTEVPVLGKYEINNRQYTHTYEAVGTASKNLPYKINSVVEEGKTIVFGTLKNNQPVEENGGNPLFIKNVQVTLEDHSIGTMQVLDKFSFIITIDSASPIASYSLYDDHDVVVYSEVDAPVVYVQAQPGSEITQRDVMAAVMSDDLKAKLASPTQIKLEEKCCTYVKSYETEVYELSTVEDAYSLWRSLEMEKWVEMSGDIDEGVDSYTNMVTLTAGDGTVVKMSYHGYYAKVDDTYFDVSKIGPIHTLVGDIGMFAREYGTRIEN